MEIKAYSAMWLRTGRRFQEIGRFTSSGWDLGTRVFPTEQHGLNGRHFLIGTQFVSKNEKLNDLQLTFKGRIYLGVMTII